MPCLAAPQSRLSASLQVRPLFDKFDKDLSGSIDPEEMRVVCDELGLKLSAEQYHAVITEADADGNGQIDFDEFIVAIRSIGTDSQLLSILDSALSSSSGHASGWSGLGGVVKGLTKGLKAAKSSRMVLMGPYKVEMGLRGWGSS